MAYTTPKTWSSGDVLTSADMNTYVRDNMAATAGSALPRCRVHNSAAISIPDSTFTALTFDTERFDVDTMHSTATNTSRITITTAGTYLITGYVTFAANATGTRYASIRLGGTTNIGAAEVPAASGAATTTLNPTALYTFTAAQYVELVVFQSSTAALNVTLNANVSPEFSAILLAF